MLDHELVEAAMHEHNTKRYTDGEEAIERVRAKAREELYGRSSRCVLRETYTKAPEDFSAHVRRLYEAELREVRLDLGMPTSNDDQEGD